MGITPQECKEHSKIKYSHESKSHIQPYDAG
jgi:hypothetical protein